MSNGQANARSGSTCLRVWVGSFCAERAAVARMSSKLRKALLLPMLLAGGGAPVDAHAAAAAIELDVARDLAPNVDAAPRVDGAVDLAPDFDRNRGDLPETIGPYGVIRSLGSGGMGDVY